MLKAMTYPEKRCTKFLPFYTVAKAAVYCTECKSFNFKDGFFNSEDSVNVLQEKSLEIAVYSNRKMKCANMIFKEFKVVW